MELPWGVNNIVTTTLEGVKSYTLLLLIEHHRGAQMLTIGCNITYFRVFNNGVNIITKRVPQTWKGCLCTCQINHNHTNKLSMFGL